MNEDNPHVFTGEVEGHKFLAKRRYWAKGSEDLARVRDYREKGFSTPKHLLSLNSVLSEITLSPEVKRIICSAEAQEIARAHNFSGIRFVEPIMGYIVKETGEKGAVYDFVDALGPYDYFADHEDDRISLDGWDKVTYNIKSLLSREGIRAIDLRAKDVLVDDEYLLHLVDIEAFHKL